MQARVIDAGGVDPGLIAYHMYRPVIDPRVEEMFRRKFHDVYDTLASVGSKIAETVKNVSNYFLSDEVTRQAKELIQDASVIIRDDIIQCHDYNNIYDAGYLTRRYIMADPRLYDMYRRNRINGWGDEFYDPEPDIPGEWRDDYLDVIDGWVDESITQATHVVHPIESNLSDWDRMCVRELWKLSERIVDEGRDPTDPDKGEL